jgi:flavin-dependent dehydrogenase
MSKATNDVVIIGGGLAGSAAAITLARAGRSVLLLEKESKAHHKVCGEFLSHEALAYLRQLGLQPEALGAVPITSVRFAGRLGVSESALPFAAMSLTRKALDEELLRLAKLAGVQVCRGTQVQSLEAADESWKVTQQDATSITVRSIFLATGKHDLRGHARPAGVQSDLIGFKMYWQLTPAQTKELEGHVELNLFRGGYGGMQLLEGGIANLCCVVRRKDFARMGSRWSPLLEAMQRDCAHLQRRLCGARALLDRPLAISHIPYGYVRERSQNLWYLGDQAAVIPSFTGDGMSIALHSGKLAATMYLSGASPEAFQRQLHADVAKQVSFATILSKGMVTEPHRTVMEAASRIWPGALRFIANRTRLSAESMVSSSHNKLALQDASMGSY